MTIAISSVQEISKTIFCRTVVAWLIVITNLQFVVAAGITNDNTSVLTNIDSTNSGFYNNDGSNLDGAPATSTMTLASLQNEIEPKYFSSRYSASNSQKNSVPEKCEVVMAPSTLPDSGFGVFTLTDRPRGISVLTGDIVIQVSDLNLTHADGMKFFIQDYVWTGEITGGFYEGQSVFSVIPGVGMLANGLSNNQHNILSFVPSVDEGGLTRLESPGAGAITHYHNYTFFVQRPIVAGGELFANYGEGWFQERKERVIIPASVEHGISEPSEKFSTGSAADLNRIAPMPQDQQQQQQQQQQQEVLPFSRNVNWLRKHGQCLDNLRPGRSRTAHAGRGAFATRDLPVGSIVSPVPVLTINKRESLHVSRKRLDGSTILSQQLLLNYCIGHKNSSMLLFPYAPFITLINHGHANVKLQWSASPMAALDWPTRPLSDVKQTRRSGLMLELVATQDIFSGEEILLNYGRDWVEAWKNHVRSWKPQVGAERYAPAYVHDDAVRSLRIEAELRNHPYPENVFTSCFYRYSDNKQQAEASSTSQTVTTYRWKLTRGLFELTNLRPCQILQREHDKNEGTLFTARILNRFGLEQRERLPKGAVHIITHVPRKAVRFSDKLYTTDQHLENAFRHEIGFEGFPKQWLDLA